MSRRSGLGRGIGALIPTDLVSDDRGALREIPISAIDPNPYQPRESFDEASLSALADSIRELGVLQPVLVRVASADRFELIAGERRLRAARRAGLSAIPAIIREVTDTGSLEQALVENLHRADLNPLEEAAAYQQLIEDFGLTQEDVAVRVGKSRPAVANTLRLLQLSGTIQRFVAEQRLSAGHARALLGTPDRTLQEALARRVLDEGLTVRQLEEAVRRAVPSPQAPHLPAPPREPDRSTTQPPTTQSFADASAPPEPDVPEPLSPGSAKRTLGGVSPTPGTAAPGTRDLPQAALLELEGVLGDYFETTVTVTMGRGRGRLVIEFADLEDLERVYRLIVHEA